MYGAHIGHFSARPRPADKGVSGLADDLRLEAAVAVAGTGRSTARMSVSTVLGVVPLRRPAGSYFSQPRWPVISSASAALAPPWSHETVGRPGRAAPAPSAWASPSS